ncbi:hypothetical protein ACF0H5_021445 [Mactra antiquata]
MMDPLTYENLSLLHVILGTGNKDTINQSYRTSGLFQVRSCYNKEWMLLLLLVAIATIFYVIMIHTRIV